jgi:hypothetical protein
MPLLSVIEEQVYQITHSNVILYLFLHLYKKISKATDRFAIQGEYEKVLHIYKLPISIYFKPFLMKKFHFF